MEARGRLSAASTTTTPCPSEDKASANAPTANAAGSAVPTATTAKADPGADSRWPRSRRSIMRRAGFGSLSCRDNRLLRITRGLRWRPRLNSTGAPRVAATVERSGARSERSELKITAARPTARPATSPERASSRVALLRRYRNQRRRIQDVADVVG